MLGKSRRIKRRRRGTTSSSQGTPSNSKVVSLSTRRRRRPKTKGDRPPGVTPPAAPTTPQQPLAPRSRRRSTSRATPPRLNARRLRIRLPKTILYPLRFTIVGVGIGAVIGTILAISNSRPYINVTQDVDERSQEFVEEPVKNPLPMTKPLLPLQETTKAAIAADAELDATLLFVDLDSGEYLDIAATRTVSAASTIKIPVLVAFFEAVDQGKVRLDQVLTITEAVKGGGSGGYQYKDNGTQFPALDVAAEMSINSDNTATNMIIELLGGMDALNLKFQQWGMSQTQLKNPLPDLEGTNLTTARDLAFLLAQINQGDILSIRSRDRLMRIMGETSNDRLLPQSLDKGAAIAHKTGDIGFIIGDAGIVDMPNGKRYVASIFVERPYDSPKGKELLHQISRQFYEYLATEAKPPAEVTPPATPSPEAAPADQKPSLETASFQQD